MKLNLYAVRDHLLNVSFAPMAFPSDAAAVRSFRSMCGNKDSVIFQNPTDFSISKIGEFDVDSGQITTVPHEVVASGVREFKE